MLKSDLRVATLYQLSGAIRDSLSEISDQVYCLLRIMDSFNFEDDPGCELIAMSLLENLLAALPNELFTTNPLLYSELELRLKNVKRTLELSKRNLEPGNLEVVI